MSNSQNPDEIRLVKEFLLNAFHTMEQGDSQNYDYLCQQLQTTLVTRDGTHDATLNRMLLALAQTVSPISENPQLYEKLVNILLQYDWNRTAELSATFINFLSNLVSANGCFLVPAFTVILRHILIPCQSVEPSPTDGSNPYRTAATQAKFDCLQQALRRLLALVPLGTGSLLPLLTSHFPHRRLPREALVSYAEQLLLLGESVPVLRDRVMAILIGKMIEIDVEIKVETPALARADSSGSGSGGSDSGIFAFDMDGLGDGGGGGGGSGGKGGDAALLAMPPPPPRTPHPPSAPALAIPCPPTPAAAATATPATPAAVAAAAGGASVVGDEMASKLDGLMELALSYLRSCAQQGAARQEALYISVLRVFEGSVLLTHRSKYTQFLLFYICQFQLVFVDTLVSHLLTGMLDDAAPEVTRLSCAAYTASFLSRASYIHSSTLRSVLHHMLTWAHAYADQHATAATAAATVAAAAAASTASPKHRLAVAAAAGQGVRHRVFYSVCQAACYMLCFKGDVIVEGGWTVHLQQLRWEQLLTGPLNPLAFCLESVAHEFIRLCRRLQLCSQATLAHLRAAAAERQRQRMQLLRSLTPSASAARRAHPMRPLGGGGGGGDATTPLAAFPRGGIDSPSHNGGSGDGSGGRGDAWLASVSGGMGVGSNPLDSFFPFDPYLLSQSYHYIEPIYQSWAQRDSDSDSSSGSDSGSGSSSGSSGSSSDSSSSSDESSSDSDAVGIGYGYGYSPSGGGGIAIPPSLGSAAVAIPVGGGGSHSRRRRRGRADSFGVGSSSVGSADLGGLVGSLVGSLEGMDLEGGAHGAAFHAGSFAAGGGAGGEWEVPSLSAAAAAAAAGVGVGVASGKKRRSKRRSSASKPSGRGSGSGGDGKSSRRRQRREQRKQQRRQRRRQRSDSVVSSSGAALAQSWEEPSGASLHTLHALSADPLRVARGLHHDGVDAAAAAAAARPATTTAASSARYRAQQLQQFARAKRRSRGSGGAGVDSGSGSW